MGTQAITTNAKRVVTIPLFRVGVPEYDLTAVLDLLKNK